MKGCARYFREVVPSTRFQRGIVEVNRRVYSFFHLWREHWFVWLILAVAILARIGGVTHGVSFHPDERHIISVTERMLREGDPNPHFFAYGSFPFYLHAGMALLLRPIWPFFATYDGLYIVGRSIAVLCGVVTVFLTFRIGGALSGSKQVGALAALLLALNVFHVQLSRFYTVDILLTALYLAALGSFLRIVRGGGRSDYVISGVLVGLAVATKISALSLLAPFLIAVGYERYRRSDWKRWRSYLGVVLTVGIAVVTFCSAAPYSLIDYTTFLQHNREQIAMTRGEWRPPYTVQYAQTVPYLYPLEQIYRYTFGALPALAAILGTVWVVMRQFRRPSPGVVVLLVGILPFLALVAGLQVKFPRYLLPIYPILCLFGAMLLVDVGERLVIAARTARWRTLLRWVPAGVVVAWATVYVLAFVGIYRQPHSYVTASEWIFQHVPTDSGILGVHWDDKLPISLPGLSPHQFRYRFEGREHELAVYEPESPAKFDQMVAQLASHDFLVFPTARTYGSIPLLPDEFPETSRLFSALFRGELGYGLVQSFKVRPSLGAITFNDDLADESFSVYDHPKVLVFKNIARLSAEEIARRIRLQGVEAPILSPHDLLRRDSAMNASVPVDPSSWWSLVIWLLILQIAAWSVAPFLVTLFSAVPDRGLGIAQALGPLVYAFLVWNLTWYLGLPSNGWVGGAVLLGGAFGAHCFVRARWGSWRAFFIQVESHLRIVQTLFLGVFLLFAVIRSMAPEIFWGEKPMESTFLHYFVRSTELPPYDPWVAGHPMGYYYLGFYLLGLVHKVGGIDPAIGFNLGIASIAGWLVAALYSIGVWATRVRWGGVAVALGVALLGNFEAFRLAVFEDRPWNFDLFWASSRVLASPAITEYPLWSLLFADLHAHLIALPFVVVLLFLAIAALSRPTDPEGRRGLYESLLHGGVLGILFALNSWDFISCSFVTGLIFLLRLTLADRGSGWWRGIGRVLSDACVVALVAGLVMVPFVVTSVKTERVYWGWVRGEFATLGEVARHLGIWWVALLVGGSASLLMFLLSGCARGTLKRIACIAGVAAVPLGLGVFAGSDGITGFSWPLLGAWSFLACVAAVIVFGRNERIERRALGVLTLAGVYIGGAAELLFLMDRMNTIFKFYHFVWLSLAISAIAFVVGWCRGGWGDSLRSRLARGVGIGVLGVSGGLALFGTVVALWCMVGFQRVDGPRPTLNGQAYLGRMNRADLPLIEWLQRNVVGTPTILEAWGDPYGPFTRIAMHTGLPTVLGWEHHVRQRGASDVDVQRRKRDIAVVYTTPDIVTALRILKRYDVSYLVVSALERTSYRGGGLTKFERYPDLFVPVQRSAEGVLYKVTLPPSGVIDGVR